MVEPASVPAIIKVRLGPDLYVEDVLSTNGISREEFDARVAHYIKDGRIALEVGEKTRIVFSAEAEGKTMLLVRKDVSDYFEEVHPRVRSAMGVTVTKLYDSFIQSFPKVSPAIRQAHLLSILLTFMEYSTHMAEVVLQPNVEAFAAAYLDFLGRKMDINAFEEFKWCVNSNIEGSEEVISQPGVVIDGIVVPETPGPDTPQ